MYIYSAADLVKRSAAQIVYFRETGKKKEITPMMLEGIEHQKKCVQNLIASTGGKVYEELCGRWIYFDNYGVENDVYFSVDAVGKKTLFEVKSLKLNEGEEFPQWYLESSILQCVVYKSLINNLCSPSYNVHGAVGEIRSTDNDGILLKTAKFRLDEGYECEQVSVDPTWGYTLLFGDNLAYNIKVDNEDMIISFIKMKIDALANYTTARAFDQEYKRREFNVLREFFTYEEINSPLLQAE